MAASPNPYLAGNFAPVREEVDLACPTVEGTIPRDLAGFFLRTGPNPQFEPIDPALYHPFDGDGMLHEVEFRGGRATYRNRWVRTQGFERERREGKAIWGGFLTFGKIEVPPDMPMKNVANTAFAWHANRLLATWEGGSPHAVRLPDLSTIGEYTFDGGWTEAVTAHPKVDPRTGEMIIFCYSPAMPPYVRYGVVSPAGKVVHRTSVDLAGKPVMIHDIAITPRYSLILDMPVTASLERMMTGGRLFDWEPSNGARIGVLPRYGTGADVKWFDINVGYVFHVFNAWEEGDEVVLDACRSNMTVILAETDAPLSDQQARLHQYRLDMSTGKATERRVNQTPLEFSRINEGYMGTQTRYGYASRFDRDDKIGLRFTAVLKYDREGERLDVCELGEGRYTQEFVFAPKLGSRAEDDGYVVGFAHDEGSGATDCWVIDAQRFDAGPVARVRMPKRVPYGFHSHWVSAEASGT